MDKVKDNPKITDDDLSVTEIELDNHTEGLKAKKLV
jgi:hypothetical protein